MQTTNLIEIAVAPMKSDAIKRAEENAQQRIEYISKKPTEAVNVPPRGIALNASVLLLNGLTRTRNSSACRGLS